VYFYISKQEINFHKKMSVNKTSQARNSSNAFLQHLSSRIIIKKNVSTDLHFAYISAHHMHKTCILQWLKISINLSFYLKWERSHCDISTYAPYQ